MSGEPRKGESVKSKVKFVHCADIHLGYEQYGSEERFVDFAKAFREVARFAIEKKVDFMLISGDLFHKASINAATLQQACAILRVLKEKKIGVIAIEGNHDDALYSDRMSWLRYLAAEELLILLDPVWDDEKKVQRWDAERKIGSYYDIFLDEEKNENKEIADVRIFGIGYLGAATEHTIKDIANRLGKECTLGRFNIMLMHLGIEGFEKMSGCINIDALMPFRDKIDYIALGHVHSRYELMNWVYNPGSTETCSISEIEKERGFYYVELGENKENSDKDGKLEILHIEHVKNKRRRFCRYDLKVTGLSSPSEVYSAVEKSYADISSKLGLEVNINDGKVVYVDEMDRPVIEYNLVGNPNFDIYAIDYKEMEKKIERMLSEKFDAIVVKVNNEISPLDLEVEIKSEDGHVNKYELEYEVLKKRISCDDRYKHAAGLIAELAIELKESCKKREPAESLLYSINRNIEKIFRLAEEEKIGIEVNSNKLEQRDVVIEGGIYNDRVSIDEGIKEGLEDGLEKDVGLDNGLNKNLDDGLVDNGLDAGKGFEESSNELLAKNTENNGLEDESKKEHKEKKKVKHDKKVGRYVQSRIE